MTKNLSPVAALQKNSQNLQKEKFTKDRNFTSKETSAEVFIRCAKFFRSVSV